MAFRDITDGTSNTILTLETSPMHAVEWTKPSDVTIDRGDPLEKLVEGRANGFNVNLADGAVVFITNQVDPELLWALLTRAGGEVVDQP